MKKLLSLVGACAACVSMYAQSYDYPWAIGLYGGRTEYAGEWGKDFFNVGAKFHGHAGLSVDRYLNRNFDVTLFGSYGYYGSERGSQEFEAGLANANLTLKYKFPMIPQNYRFHPFIFIGAGARDVMDIDKPSKRESHVDEGFDAVADGGIGINLRLTNHWSMRYIGSYGYGFSDKHDQRECGDWDDQQLLHSIGIVYAFSTKPRDTDKDGVPDKFDKCPGTPAGVSVDANGCPLDADGDGVPDYLDKCPDTPKEAKVDSTGCPLDEDGDGVGDYKDQCPGTPAGVKVDEKGCPLDSDHDGVPDYKDNCPDSPAEAAGHVDSVGCPLDTDGDGVFDYEDVCPDKAGLKENKGCPAVKASVKKLFKQALNGIQFESGNAKIKNTSYGILNQIVKVMNENPEYKLDIAGHTDNSGNSAKNQKLSEDRANAVKSYIANKGVDASRMTASGFGDSQPVASNKTKAGKALNRRVAFNVVFEKTVDANSTEAAPAASPVQ